MANLGQTMIWSSAADQSATLLAPTVRGSWESSGMGSDATLLPAEYAVRHLGSPGEVERHHYAGTTGVEVGAASSTEVRWTLASAPSSFRISAGHDGEKPPALLRKVQEIAEDWGFAQPASNALGHAGELLRFLEAIQFIAPWGHPPLAVVRSLPDEDSGVSLYFERLGRHCSDRHTAITFHDDETATLSLTRFPAKGAVATLQHAVGGPQDALKWLARIVDFLEAR